MKKIYFEDALIIATEVRNILLQVDLPSNLSISEIMILNFLYKNQDKNLKEIKEMFLNMNNKVDKSCTEVRLAKKVTSLSLKGLIVKSQFEKDKRISIIKITNKGEKTINDFFKKAKEFWK